jgi:hypothetical protein
MTINQVVAGAAALTSSATAFSASVPGNGQTFTVASAAGYPSSGRFVVQLQRGQSDEEKILIASRSGTTFTVQTRGYDDTTAASHTNPTVNLILPATVVNALIEHADDIEAAPHATKLPVGTISGHDTTTRHVFGVGATALGVPGTPTTITPDDSGNAGSGSRPAREDHRHAVTTATAVAVTTALGEGSAATFSRSDHAHTIGVGAISAANMFAAGVVDAAAIATDGVGSAEIAAGAVGSGELGAAAVIAGKIAAGGVSATTEFADGIISLAKLLLEDPVSYAPTAASFGDSAGGAVTMGTGGTTYGYYFKAGRLVVFLCGFAMAADGNVPSGTAIRIPAPFTQRALTTMRGFVAARSRLSSPETYASGTGVIQAGNNYGENIATAGASAQWDATLPWNWGTPGSGAATVDAIGIMVSTT